MGKLFDYYKIPEERQRDIFENGIHFDFTYGDPDPTHRNSHLNVFGVGILLKTCKENKIRISIKQLLNEPWMFKDEELIRDVANMQNGHHYTRIRKLGRHNK